MADYWVDPVSGSNGNAGSEASPWKSAEYAAGQVSAGDTVYLKSGTYTNTEWFAGDVGLGGSSAVSGTPGNLVTFKADTGASVVINTTSTARFYGIDYWRFEDIELHKDTETMQFGENNDNVHQSFTAAECLCSHWEFDNIRGSGLRGSQATPFRMRGLADTAFNNIVMSNIRDGVQGAGSGGNIFLLGTNSKNITLTNSTFTDIGNDVFQVSNLAKDLGTCLIENVECKITRPYWHLDDEGNQSSPQYAGGFYSTGENGLDFKSLGTDVSNGTVTIRGCTFEGYRPGNDPQDVSGGNGPGLVFSINNTLGCNITVEDCDFINNTIGLRIAGNTCTASVTTNRFHSVSDSDRSYPAQGDSAVMSPTVNQGSTPCMVSIATPGSVTIEDNTFWQADDGETPLKYIAWIEDNATNVKFNGNLVYVEHNSPEESTEWMIESGGSITSDHPNRYFGIAPDASFAHAGDDLTDPVMDGLTWEPSSRATPGSTTSNTANDYYGDAWLSPKSFGAVQSVANVSPQSPEPSPSPSPSPDGVTDITDRALSERTRVSRESNLRMNRSDNGEVRYVDFGATPTWRIDAVFEGLSDSERDSLVETIAGGAAGGIRVDLGTSNYTGFLVPGTLAWSRSSGLNSVAITLVGANKDE